MAVYRTRYWEIIAYPESLPDDWIDILREERVGFVVSPLHDMDVHKDTGELKKPHYHVLLFYSSVKSFNQIREVALSINQGMVKEINDIRKAVRYTIHLDDKDKAPYKFDDIQAYGGVDFSQYFTCSSLERTEISRNILQLIRDRKIIEFSDLMDIIDTEFDSRDYYEIVKQETYFFRAYLSSKRNRGY